MTAGDDNAKALLKTLCLSSKDITRFSFHKQPSYFGSNVNNGVKVKQLAKQHPTLKTLMQ